MRALRVGVFGTSWWADSMYLPAIAAFDGADVVGVCGRDRDRTRAFADRWDVASATVDADELLAADLDAVIVATTNDSHMELTMAALDAGAAVLCEKPLALTAGDAWAMAGRASEAGVTTLVPFTYRYMPVNRHLKALVDDGYVGRPYHLNLRYYTGFAREPVYAWRFDADRAGSGVLGDLGSHWLHLARWLLGEVTEIGATTSTFVHRPPRPDGTPYRQAEDAVMITVRFENGASGHLFASAMCHEGGAFGQSHHVEVHGSDGTLHAECDWHTVQSVRGVRSDEPGPPGELPIPDDIWAGARRQRVHDTYRDVFRSGGAMVGDFLAAARAGRPVQPDFTEGARVQTLLELAASSAAAGGTMLPAS